MFRTTLAGVAFSLLAGCGTILTPAESVVSITSNPPGAKVLCDGKPMGTTPCSVTLPSQHQKLWLERTGYQPRVIELGKTPNPWIRLNILNLGVGLMVDVGSGMDRVPNSAAAHVALRHLGASASTPVWQRTTGSSAAATTSCLGRSGRQHSVQHALAGLGPLARGGLRAIAYNNR